MIRKFLTIAMAFVMCLSGVVMLAGCGESGMSNTFEEVINWDNIDWEGKNDSSNKITVFFGNDMKQYYMSKIEAFEKEFSQYEVDVRWGGAGDGVKQEQNSALTSNPPDLILGGDVHIENQKGFLLPLNKLIERDIDQVQPDDFLDGLLDSLTSGEGVYYLPTTFNASVLLYNTKLFAENNVDVPTEDWTFADFVEAGKKFVKYENGVATQWGNQTVTEWWTQWYSMYAMDGGELIDDEGYVSLNNETGIRALENWRSLAGVQGKALSEFPNKIGTHNGADGGNLGNFAAGKVAMLYSTACGQLMEFSNAPGLEFDVAPMPKSSVTNSREGTELSVTAYGIHKNSKNKKGAWELLKWLTSPRTDLDELADFALPVVRESERDLMIAVPKAERKTKYKNIEAIYAAFETSKPLPRVSYFEEVVMQYLLPEINKLLDGTNATPAEAARKAEEAANSYIMLRYKMDF